MYQYWTYTELTDSGPYLTRLILELPQEVTAGTAAPDQFSVFACRRNRQTGKIIQTRTRGFSPESLQDIENGLSLGWRKITQVYPCNEQGDALNRSDRLALVMSWGPLEPLSLWSAPRTAELNDFVEMEIRVTQIAPIPGTSACVGMVFDTCAGDIRPQMAGWQFSEEIDESRPLRYAWYSPKGTGKEKRPLLIWLHGAGGGGEDPRYPVQGNRVTALSSPEGQRKLGHPLIFVPQCPTVWMDDGEGTPLMTDNRSIYFEDLERSIAAFILDHSGEIDRNRIYIAGASNGGFMAVMQVIRNPSLFAAAVPVCEAVLTDQLSDRELEALSQTPLWLIHTKGDFVVPPEKTALSLYKRLKTLGGEVHFTYLDRVWDTTGQFKNRDGTPYRYIPHFAWVPFYNDECRTDFDGSPVVVDGQAVTVQEWLGTRKRESEAI